LAGVKGTTRDKVAAFTGIGRTTLAKAARRCVQSYPNTARSAHSRPYLTSPSPSGPGLARG
jgi:hypothetical protein